MKYFFVLAIAALSLNAKADGDTSLDVLAKSLSGTYNAHDECKNNGVFGGQDSSKGSVTITATPSGADRIILTYDYQRLTGKAPVANPADAVLGGRIEITQIESLVSRTPGQPNLAGGKVSVKLATARGRVAGGWTPDRPVNTSLVSSKSAAWKEVAISIDPNSGNINFAGSNCDGHVLLTKNNDPAASGQ